LRELHEHSDKLLPLTKADVVDEIATVLARAVLRLGRNRLSQPVKLTGENSETLLDNRTELRLHVRST
jgi:hypothetical protein